jgi:hypothetical protein
MPLALWAGCAPQTGNIYPFGVKAYIHIPSDNHKKLDNRARLCFLVGYLEDGGGWYFWDGGGNQFILSLVAEFVDYLDKSPLPKMAPKGRSNTC